MARTSFRALVLPILLVCLYQPTADAHLIDTAVNFIANKALGTYMTGGAKVQPSVFKVVDAIAHKRKKRGDKEGAARALGMKQWFNFMGVRKGIPAIAMQLFSHRSLLTNTFGLVTGTALALQTRAAEVGIAKAWEEQSGDVTKVTKSVVSKITAAIPTGAIHAFFKDISHELRSEHLASDILEEVMPTKEQRQQMMGSFQKYLGMLRSALNSMQNGEQQHESEHQKHNDGWHPHDQHSETGEL